MLIAKTTLFTALAAMSLAAADDPFVGNWKVNPSKSQFAGFRMRAASLGDNKYRLVMGSVTRIVTFDGTDQPDGFGQTTSVKQVARDTWDYVDKKDGRILDQGTWKLSQDGKTMEAHETNYGLDGKVNGKSRLRFEREGGGTGFAGSWVSRSATSSNPAALEIQPNGDGYVFFTFSFSDPMIEGAQRV